MPRKRSPSLRAQSWIYGAINPLIDALESEHRFLAHGDLTWSFRTRKPELIRHPANYLLSNGQIVLADLEKARGGELTTAFAEHGRKIDAAAEKANAVFDELLGNPDFRKAVAASMRAFEERNRDAPWRSWSEEETTSEIAEYLINSRAKLPSNNSFKSFWEAAANDLFLFARVQGVASFRDLRTMLKGIANETSELIEKLSDLRFKLCEEFDVPAAPVEGIIGL